MKHAELFAGYGGLSLAVEAAFGAELAWYAEFDPAPSRIMARHWPDVPNHRDVTQIDWSQVEPVDIISGGSPCQDVSAAGRRAGMNEGTRSNLWVAMREAIARIKPTYVIWENVAGARSASAYSELEPCAGCLGDHGHESSLRALGRVLGDLASLGFDAEWRSVTASSIGAPHRRERVFVLAWRRDTAAENGHGRRAGWRDHAPGQSGGGGQDGKARLPGGSPGGTGPASEVALLPTPVAQPSGNPPEVHLRKKSGRKRVTDLAILLENGLLETGGRLLPTVEARSHKGRNGGTGKGFSADINHAVESTDFGTYTAAIRRWEQVLGRPAPAPTELSLRGRHRLSEHFCEWMMGLPQGWICDTPGITRRDAIKAAGNGVVPQQATAALKGMLQHVPATEEAA